MTTAAASVTGRPRHRYPRRVGLWDRLTPAERTALLKPGSNLEVHAGHPISGSIDSWVFVIRSGVAIGIRDVARGATRLYGAGDLMGYESPNQTNHILRAASTVHGLAIPLDQFKAVLERHPIIYEALYWTMTDQLMEADYLRGLSSLPGLEQTARGLAFLAARFGEAERGGKGRSLPLSQIELAELLGTSRETLVRAYTQLRQLGAIQTTRGKISITDSAALADACGHSDW